MIQMLYRGGGAALCRDTARDISVILHNSALRQGAGTLRYARHRALHGKGLVLRYKLCIVTGGPATRPATRPVRTVTRPEEGHDTTLCAVPQSSVRAAWVRVCALYTRLSALFTVTIWDTVHEHCLCMI